MPAGTRIKGITSATSRASGSKIPLFLRACHSAILSVKPPPQYEPRRLPMKEGILMRPLIAGVMLYGGPWKTAPQVVRAAIRNPRVEAKVKIEKIVAGYNIIGIGRSNRRK